MSHCPSIVCSAWEGLGFSVGRPRARTVPNKDHPRRYLGLRYHPTITHSPLHLPSHSSTHLSTCLQTCSSTHSSTYPPTSPKPNPSPTHPFITHRPTHPSFHPSMGPPPTYPLTRGYHGLWYQVLLEQGLEEELRQAQVPVEIAEQCSGYSHSRSELLGLHWVPCKWPSSPRSPPHCPCLCHLLCCFPGHPPPLLQSGSQPGRSPPCRPGSRT